MKIKIIITTIIILLVALQFFTINKNEGEILTSNHISNTLSVPEDIEKVLTTSCYDCHSNKTNYPWYSSLQPLGWWIQYHVNEGKEEVNFSEFTSYSLKKQIHKMEEVIEMMEENEMPLYSYTIIHHESKLTDEQKTRIINWAKQAITELKTSGKTE
jgi:hypothetical protein